MKIKNMKLMLLGLLTVMGVSNAFAAVDEESRSVNDVLYKLETNGANKTATVVGVNTLASTANQETISIPATVEGEHGTYKVVGFDANWATKVLNVTAKTKTLSIDVTNFTAQLANIEKLTKLESLTITDTNGASTNKKLDLSAAAGTFGTTLKTLNIAGSKIEEIAASGLKDFAALESIDLGQIKKIGDNALDGCKKITSLTVPATVTSVGTSAFDNMSELKTLVWNANLNVPAAFAGASKLENITVAGGDKLTTIASGAFTSTVVKNVDLTGSAKLATIAGAFAVSTKFESVKMNGTSIAAADAIDISGSQATLTTWTCADNFTSFPSFAGFVKLTAVDLSKPKAGTSTDAAVFTGDKALTTVKMNAASYKNIAASAFENCGALATIENVFNANTASIGADAFKKAGLVTLDMSAVKPGNIGQTIPAAFSEMAKLTTVILPAKQGGKAITDIESAAFYKDTKLASINLEVTEIKTLRKFFHKALSEEISYDDLTSLTLPATLTVVSPGALQFLGLESITIPSSVTTFNDHVLQGCVNLKEFIWEDAQQNWLDDETFLGDTKLEMVKFLTVDAIPGVWALGDDFFPMCDKSKLKVYVSAESYDILVADGYTPINSKYSTLCKGDGDATITFGDAAADGYYYKSYYNETNATWFAADKFDVFSAVVEGNKVVLKPATVVEGYYKVQQLDRVWTPNPEKALCIIRTKDKNNKAELKSVPLNAQQSTLPTDNQLQIADADNETTGVAHGSKINYMYQLGKVDGKVAFYRITSGNFKNNSIYIDASVSFANLGDVLEIVIESQDKATGINAIQQESENNGIYNLQGVQVQGAKKGLYIQNGKKYIVK